MTHWSYDSGRLLSTSEFKDDLINSVQFSSILFHKYIGHIQRIKKKNN